VRPRDQWPGSGTMTAVSQAGSSVAATRCGPRLAQLPLVVAEVYPTS
jgi:hypothetical protein